MQCFLAAVFKKDTKEKNQKKAEAKKRKAEQQEQQEPVDDNLAGMNEQGDPTPVTDLPLQPAQMPTQQPAEPCPQQVQAPTQVPPAAPEHEPNKQVDNGLMESATEQNM